MKRLLVILAITLLLTGCTKKAHKEQFNNITNDYNILQSDYEKLLVERDSLLTECKNLSNNYTKLETANNSLEFSYSALKDENAKHKDLYNEYFEKYGEALAENVGDDLLNAWGVSTFGSVESAPLNSDSVQLIVTVDPLNSSQLDEIYNQLLEGIELLVTTNYVDSKTVYIKVVDKYDNPVIEYCFVNNNGETKLKILYSDEYLNITSN